MGPSLAHGRHAQRRQQGLLAGAGRQSRKHEQRGILRHRPHRLCRRQLRDHQRQRWQRRQARERRHRDLHLQQPAAAELDRLRLERCRAGQRHGDDHAVLEQRHPDRLRRLTRHGRTERQLRLQNRQLHLVDADLGRELDRADAGDSELERRRRRQRQPRADLEALRLGQGPGGKRLLDRERNREQQPPVLSSGRVVGVARQNDPVVLGGADHLGQDRLDVGFAVGRERLV